MHHFFHGALYLAKFVIAFPDIADVQISVSNTFCHGDQLVEGLDDRTEAPDTEEGAYDGSRRTDGNQQHNACFDHLVDGADGLFLLTLGRRCGFLALLSLLDNNGMKFLPRFDRLLGGGNPLFQCSDDPLGRIQFAAD